MAHTGNARQGRGQGVQQIVGAKKMWGGEQPEYVNVFLTDDGASDGDINAIGVYSTTSGPDTHFWHAATEEFVVARMLIFIEDTTGAASADYGNIANGITNGIGVKVFEADASTVVQHITPEGHNITTNAEWARMCYDQQHINQGAGNDFIAVRWTFARSGVEIHMKPGQHFAVVLHDNLSGLIQHNFLIQGYHPQTFH